MTAYQTGYFLNERNVNYKKVRQVSMCQKCPEETILISPFWLQKDM